MSVPKKRMLLSLDDDSDEELAPVEVNLRDAVNRYRIQPGAADEDDPLVWWSLHAGAFPEISELAINYLATPATSVPCERLFSKAGQVVNKQRASFAPQNVNKRVCLMDWL